MRGGSRGAGEARTAAGGARWPAAPPRNAGARRRTRRADSAGCGRSGGLCRANMARSAVSCASCARAPARRSIPCRRKIFASRRLRNCASARASPKAASQRDGVGRRPRRSARSDSRQTGASLPPPAPPSGRRGEAPPLAAAWGDALGPGMMRTPCPATMERRRGAEALSAFRRGTRPYPLPSHDTPAPPPPPAPPPRPRPPPALSIPPTPLPHLPRAGAHVLRGRPRCV